MLSQLPDASRETGLATQLFRATAASGGIDQDDLVVARLFEQLAGMPQPDQDLRKSF